jgi:DNA polymerase I-like protein with 3'-5' exonuclease and polymerase domains
MITELLKTNKQQLRSLYLSLMKEAIKSGEISNKLTKVIQQLGYNDKQVANDEVNFLTHQKLTTAIEELLKPQLDKPDYRSIFYEVEKRFLSVKEEMEVARSNWILDTNRNSNVGFSLLTTKEKLEGLKEYE